LHYGFFEDAKNISVDAKIYADAKSCRTKKKIFSEQQEQKHIIFVFLKQEIDWKN